MGVLLHVDGNTGNFPELPNNGKAHLDPSNLFIRIENVVSKSTTYLCIALTAATAVTFTALLLAPGAITSSLFIFSGIVLSSFAAIKGIEHLKAKMPPKLKHVANYVKATIVDAFAVTMLILLKPVPFHKFFPRDVTKYKGVPILYIHGYLSHGLTGSYLDHRMQAEGLGPYYHLNLGLPFGKNLEIYTEKVKRKIAKIAKETGSNQIKLVGHSMGGVIATYYTACYAPKDSVTHVVTLGSPLEGTKMAKFALDNCAKSMQKEASFIDNLAEKINKTVKTTRFLHIGSDVDLVVRPPMSTLFFQNQTPHVERILFDDIGHSTYLFSDKVVDQVTYFLHKAPAAITV